jgi:hypothetical protein
MVTIEKIGTDVCALSGKQSEGVYCKFADGSFQGFLTWKSLQQLLSLKQSQRQEKKDPQQGRDEGGTEGLIF